MLSRAVGSVFRANPLTWKLAVYCKYGLPDLLKRTWNRRYVNVTNVFPAYSPMVTGPYKQRGLLTIQSVNETFPVIVRMIEISTNIPFEKPLPIESVPIGARAEAAAEALKRLFDTFGSDKARAHNYHHLYGHILSSINSVSAMLEIGLGTNDSSKVSNMGKGGSPGASLRAFRDFLPSAKIYGADIDRSILFEEENIKTYFVDQTDFRSLDELSAKIGRKLDLIIDDGLHAPFANIASLSFALKNLKLGGWFVAEDISAAALPIWRVVACLLPSNCVSYLIAARGSLVFAMRCGG